MKRDYRSTLDDLISERLDYILDDFRKNNPRIREKEINLVKLSQDMQRAISGLGSNEKNVIDEYMSEINTLTYEYNSAVYIKGLRDCVRFLKGVGVI